MPHLLRTELGGAAPSGRGPCLLSLLVFSVLFMVFLFSVATRTGLLPGVNY